VDVDARVPRGVLRRHRDGGVARGEVVERHGRHPSLLSRRHGLGGAPLPPAGTVIGKETTVCDECERTRNEKKIKAFKRTWEILPDSETCLLEQGLLCCGIATRAGCGALCPKVNSPCIGCHGPNSGVEDFGARMMTALASVIDANTPEEIQRIIEDGIPDPLGTFYRFSLAHSMLRRSVLPGGNGRALPLTESPVPEVSR